ncbi:MAG: hypothetical protein LAP87_06675 [Acidobacteriia bacterium]|nr:hypothetical protein [Terriglobia bacterium]
MLHLRLDALPVFLNQTGNPGQKQVRRLVGFLGLGEESGIPGSRHVHQGEATIEFPLDQDQQIVIRSGTEHSEFLRVG